MTIGRWKTPVVRSVISNNGHCRLGPTAVRPLKNHPLLSADIGNNGRCPLGPMIIGRWKTPVVRSVISNNGHCRLGPTAVRPLKNHPLLSADVGNNGCCPLGPMTIGRWKIPVVRSVISNNGHCRLGPTAVRPLKYYFLGSALLLAIRKAVRSGVDGCAVTESVIALRSVPVWVGFILYITYLQYFSALLQLHISDTCIILFNGVPNVLHYLL
jgi:hypothetical protein